MHWWFVHLSCDLRPGYFVFVPRLQMSYLVSRVDQEVKRGSYKEAVVSAIVLYFDTVHNSPGTCSATFCMHGKEHTASLHTSLATSLESHANPYSLRLLILMGTYFSEF